MQNKPFVVSRFITSVHKVIVSNLFSKINMQFQRSVFSLLKRTFLFFAKTSVSLFIVKRMWLKKPPLWTGVICNGHVWKRGLQVSTFFQTVPKKLQRTVFLTTVAKILHKRYCSLTAVSLFIVKRMLLQNPLLWMCATCNAICLKTCNAGVQHFFKRCPKSCNVQFS